MGALSDEELPVALEARSRAWSRGASRSSTRSRVLRRSPRAPAVRVHVKLDTGMGRLGTRDPRARRCRVAERVAAAAPALELAGAMTHFASADEDPEFTARQLARFAPVRAERCGSGWPGIVVHAANSAATLREPASHFDLVRCGIAIYGLRPDERAIPPRTASSRRSS